jgi:hypothetical protein
MILAVTFRFLGPFSRHPWFYNWSLAKYVCQALIQFRHKIILLSWTPDTHITKNHITFTIARGKIILLL